MVLLVSPYGNKSIVNFSYVSDVAAIVLRRFLVIFAVINNVKSEMLSLRCLNSENMS